MEESLPVCKYGADCYRKNPDHLLKFSHPSKAPEVSAKSVAPPEPSESVAAALVVVILVGVPGSGKSRFCHSVIANASQTWTRICQDVIANGKRGTKAQCIKEASNALNSSSSVFIDRTNLTKEQRLDFIEFAKKASVEAHAVVLNLPVGTCITRGISRTSHEGGLEGKGVAAVIQKMAKSLELPTLEEGFSRITVCKTDSDVDSAIDTYSKLGSSATLAPGVFESSTKSPAASKGSLQQFFKPVRSQGVSEAGKSSEVKETLAEPSFAAAEPQPRVEPITEPKDTGGDEKRPGAAEEKWKTLAFPSISTADFRFDHGKAAKIIVETASEFLKRSENGALRLVMVDIDSSSDMLSRVRSLAESMGLDRQRFLTISGDITRLQTAGGPTCLAIANAANWRLKGGGGGVNLAIYKAAGDGFEEATKQRANTLDPGKAVAVPLPSSSPLRKEGVTHVIHVLGPNMNPQRPNCIADDYDKGCRLLRAAYTSLFSIFSSLARGEAPPANEASSTRSTGDVKTPPKDAFAVLMKRKNGNDDVAPGLKRGKGPTSENIPEANDISGTSEVQSNAAGGASSTRQKSWPAWAQALHDTAFHPEKHQQVLLEVTDTAVVLPDLYAKGKKHLLVVSRVRGLDTIANVRKEHLPLLREMHAIGERWAKKLIEEDSSLVFRLGYHWVPSMRQLHLHVISQDFDSPGLKNKKHWNSFTSSFFRDSKAVISELETTGALNLCSEDMEKSLLESELRCHRCRSVHPSIPRLKSHVKSCNKPLQCKGETIAAG